MLEELRQKTASVRERLEEMRGYLGIREKRTELERLGENPRSPGERP